MGFFNKKETIISDERHVEELLKLEHEIHVVDSSLNKRNFWRKVAELAPWTKGKTHCHYRFHATENTFYIREGNCKG